MKTIIKNKRSYRSKIGRLELPDHSGSTSERTGAASGGARSNEASDGEGPGEFSNSDEGASNKEDSASNKEDSADEDGCAGSAGTKRKATGSGSGGKGKQRKL